MRFVETKTPEQQSCLMLHRARHLFIRQQTAVINSIRAYLAEFGIVAPVGRQGVEQLLGVVADANDNRLPEVARDCVAALGAQLQMLKAQILQFDRLISAWHRSSEASKRLDAIPGVGPVLATALVASVADPKAFRSGRDFSAWIGLVPKQSSSGGKERLGNISKRGDRYLRSLFTTGALAVIRFSNRPFRVKHFQTIHHNSVDEARGLVLLFGIGTKALPAWDSKTRRNNLCHGLYHQSNGKIQADMRTHLIHRPARDIIPPIGGARVSSYRL
jgi:transposase